jgi:hypothetical protein
MLPAQHLSPEAKLRDLRADMSKALTWEGVLTRLDEIASAHQSETSGHLEEICRLNLEILDLKKRLGRRAIPAFRAPVKTKRPTAPHAKKRKRPSRGKASKP